MATAPNKFIDEDDLAEPNKFMAQNEKTGNRFKYAEGQYRDKVWIFFFIAHLLVILSCGVYFGLKFMEEIQIESSSNTNTDKFKLADLRVLIYGMLIASVAGGIIGMIWLQVLKTCKLITLLYLYIGMMVIFTGFLFWLHYQLGIFGIIMLVILVFWFCGVTPRIPLSQVILRSSVEAVENNFGSIYVSIALFMVELVWAATWCFIAVAIVWTINPPSQETKITGWDHEQYVVCFFLLVSFYWTNEVIKNVGHVTTAGTIASWWFNPEQHNQTFSALKRALTTSFGSICLGSLIVAILKAIQAILRLIKNQARRSGNSFAYCLASCAECILRWIERLVRYFNMYAYTHVAVYGEDYITAAKSTYRMFQANGFSAIINDDLTGSAITVGIIIGGIAGAMTGFLYPWLFILGFLAGIIATSMVLNVLVSAIATTFVCWCEDPAAMETGRPENFQRMMDAKKLMEES